MEAEVEQRQRPKFSIRRTGTLTLRIIEADGAGRPQIEGASPNAAAGHLWGEGVPPVAHLAASPSGFEFLQ
jgi:hypothetical protein